MFNVFLLLFRNLYAKLREPFSFICFIFGFWEFAVFGWYFATWIRIQEMLRIQRIRILSTDLNFVEN